MQDVLQPAEPAVSEPDLFTLRQFAELLGWRGLRTYKVNVEGRIITWFETTDKKFFLQINPHPVGNLTPFRATVIAMRYGIPLDAVGFHDFDLKGDEASLNHRADELLPILGRHNFKRREWRRRLLNEYSRRMAEHGHGVGWPSKRLATP
jgi:hypothetical protein